MDKITLTFLIVIGVLCLFVGGYLIGAKGTNQYPRTFVFDDTLGINVRKIVVTEYKDTIEAHYYENDQNLFWRVLEKETK